MKLFNRKEITNAIRHLALDHSSLASMQPQSYVVSLIHATAKMKIEDPVIWQSLASYVS